MDAMARGSKAEPGALTVEVASILRAHIARKQLRQIDIAETVQISTSQLSDIVNGKKQIDIELLEAVCLAMDLDFMSVLRDADKATQSRLL